ncbi:hypothetical protein C8R43DRAFT_580923 [Mycena crocata]|nr:hypothetical protein C8R43DRAFT_580923 [Mycena crocata]
MEVDTVLSEPYRVPELWFEDGNIVIQAGNSLFRVFRSILAARSPVFQDMFAFPQPTNSELIDGCPLVRFLDSSAEVTVFLKALLDPEFFKPYPHRTEFDTVVGCLRLSHKYGVDSLRTRALIHLSSGYFTKLSDCDEENPPITKKVSWNEPKSWTHRISAIQLAREVECLWILPYAFYTLASWFSDIGLDIFHDTVYNGVPARLSTVDQRSFLHGYNIQRGSSARDILSCFFRPPTIEGCTTPTRCTTERLVVLDEAISLLDNVPASPFSLWAPSDCDQLIDHICPTCHASLKETLQTARQRLWDELPAMYELPPWSDLEALRTAAIGEELALFS